MSDSIKCDLRLRSAPSQSGIVNKMAPPRRTISKKKANKDIIAVLASRKKNGIDDRGKVTPKLSKTRLGNSLEESMSDNSLEHISDIIGAASSSKGQSKTYHDPDSIDVSDRDKTIDSNDSHFALDENSISASNTGSDRESVSDSNAMSDENNDSDITFKQPLPTSDDEGRDSEIEMDQRGNDLSAQKFDLIENILKVQKGIMKKKAEHIFPHARKKSKQALKSMMSDTPLLKKQKWQLYISSLPKDVFNV